MKIQKSTMTFTFLHPADDPVQEMTVEQIFEECETGGFVGSWGAEPMTTEDVPDDEVEEELQALGNDGEFFKAFEEDDPDYDDDGNLRVGV
jgi:hypothetical protein